MKLNNMTLNTQTCNVDFTQKQLSDAIILLATRINQQNVFEVLFKDCPKPKLVELLVYQMFVSDFLIDETDEIVYNSYKIILTYAKALKNDGYVMFVHPTKIERFEDDELLNLQLDGKNIVVRFHRYGEGSNSLVFIENALSIVKTAELSKIQ